MNDERVRRIELEAAREGARELARGLAEAAQGNLVMAALYGSAARGDFDPEYSDVNLLLVVEDSSLSMLAEWVDVLQSARARWRCAPLVLSREELQRGADVFPIKFHEIKRCYQLVEGADLLAVLRIEFRDLRLACEHELRNLTLKLRRTWLLDRPRPSPLVWGLHLFVPPLLGVLRVVFEHEGLSAGVSQEEFRVEVGKRYQVELKALQSALGVRHRPDASWEEVQQAYEVVLDLLAKACRQVDQWSQP